VRDLVLRLARESGSWGYLRIVGELRKHGIDVSATLVRNVLRAGGVPPAPQRGQLDWRSFLREHAATTLACDFLTVDTVFLRRLYVLVFICIGSRRIEYVACTSNPDGASMMQQADLTHPTRAPRSARRAAGGASSPRPLVGRKIPRLSPVLKQGESGQRRGWRPSPAVVRQSVADVIFGCGREHVLSEPGIEDRFGAATGAGMHLAVYFV
jgi:hypothetical protein